MDIVIAVAVLFSVLVGFVRGFFKEAVSVAALVFAVWAALNLGDDVGALAGGWLEAPELQTGFGRIVVFIVVITAGGVLGWLAAKLARMSVLSGTDRALGMAFGFCRGVVLVAVLVLMGQYFAFDSAAWWQRSALIPYAEIGADWLRVMAPKGMDLMQPEGDVDLPLDLDLRVFD